LRSVNIFDTEINAIKAQRIGRNAKIIYTVGKYGTKGLKNINPALVFIDAAISLGELVISYSNYKKSLEITKQLEIELNTLRHSYKNLLISLQLDENKYKENLKNNVEKIAKELLSNRVEYEKLVLIYQHSYRFTINFKNRINELRSSNMYDKEMQKIEEMYFETISKYTECTLEIIGG